MKKTIFYISFLTISFITNSCVEEFNTASSEFEDTIVIEATLTDQLTFQKVLLTRTFKLEDTQNQQEKESGATVRIVSNTTTYTFSETISGTYISDMQFRAEIDTDYQLLVTTQDGNEYQSEVTQLRSETSNIENIYAVSEVNDDGVEGISIYLDSYDPSGNSRYYTFGTQETYQIIAPFWKPHELVVINEDPFEMIFRDRIEEARVCYNTINSNGRLATNTNLLEEDRISRFLIKFIPNDDIRFNSRYSILVKQYVNTEQTYNFYETINELSSLGSIFSPVQPGFVAGNIISVNNPNERVIGFFEVTSIREERLFFNRDDFFIERFSGWGPDCIPLELGVDELPFSLVEHLLLDQVLGYLWETDPPYLWPTHVVWKPCGDCRVFGSNIRPNFWID